MNKVFRVLGEGWRRSRHQWAYESYYLSPGGERRSPWGAWLDYWGLRFLIWMGSLVLSLLAFSVGWGGSILLASLITLGVHFGLKRSRRQRLSKLVVERRRQLARRVVSREWMGMEPEQFTRYLAELLGKLPGFTGITMKDPEQEEGWLLATIDGKEALILGLVRGEKEEVGVRELRAFHRAVTRQGVKTGLVVTTSKFTPEAKDWAENKATGIEIYLVDGKALLDEVEKKGLLPPAEKIDSMIEKEISSLTPLAYYRQAFQVKELARRKKGRSFIYTGLLLILMAFFPGLHGFRYLYLSVAFLNFALAFWTWKPTASTGEGGNSGSSFLERPQS